jgi:hypothetical protein
MAHWDTPVPGLGFRASLGWLRGLAIDGESPGVEIRTTVDDYYDGVLSAVYEVGDLTFAAEYNRLRGRGVSRVEPIGAELALVDDSDGAYLSGTWRARPWLDLYLAGEAGFADATDRGGPHSYRLVAAVAVRPLPHWSVKLEGQQVYGTFRVLPSDNPDGLEDSWQILAVKTTVDF